MLKAVNCWNLYAKDVFLGNLGLMLLAVNCRKLYAKAVFLDSFGQRNEGAKGQSAGTERRAERSEGPERRTAAEVSTSRGI